MDIQEIEFDIENKGYLSISLKPEGKRHLDAVWDWYPATSYYNDKFGKIDTSALPPHGTKIPVSRYSTASHLGLLRKTIRSICEQSDYWRIACFSCRQTFPLITHKGMTTSCSYCNQELNWVFLWKHPRRS